MYYVSKKLEIAASHHLTTEPPTKCSRLHGHNYKVEIFCRSEELDANGMVTDFGLIKARVYDMLDHRDLNEVLPFNPTSENIARWICGQVLDMRAGAGLLQGQRAGDKRQHGGVHQGLRAGGSLTAGFPPGRPSGTIKERKR